MFMLMFGFVVLMVFALLMVAGVYLFRAFRSNKAPVSFRTRLELEFGKTIYDPGAHEIRQALVEQEMKDGFAILSESDMTYVQCAPMDDGSFRLEYQEGTVLKHFATTVSSRAEMVDVFVAFNKGNLDFRDKYEWEQVDL